MALPDGLATAEDSGTPSQLFFQHRSEVCRCLVVRKVDSGAVLCIPQGGLSEEVFGEAEENDFSGIIGPFLEAMVKSATPTGAPSRRDLQVILFDLDVAGFDGVLEQLPPGTDGDSCSGFGVYRSRQEWPHAPSLLQLCKELVNGGGTRLEPYYTADEAEEVVAPVNEGTPAGVPNGGESNQDILHQLLSQNEQTQKMVQGMQGQFAQFGSRLADLEQKRGLGRAADAPQLFSSAPAGLTEEKKDTLKQLAARGPGKLGDLGSSTRATVPLLPPNRLGGITEEEEVEDLDGEPLQDPSASTLEKLLASQQALLAQLVQSKTRNQDPLSLLSSSAHEDPDQPRGSGVKGIAGRQLLQEQFRKHPRRVVELVRERLATARRRASAAELEPRDMWLHFQESVPLGTHRTLTHAAFISAHMFEAIERNQPDRLHMLCMLLAVFVEQAAVDGGSLRLAHLLTGLEDPPFAQTELHKTARADLAHGALADPRWLTIQLQYLKDVDGVQEKSNKYGKAAAVPRAPPDGPEDPAAKTKPKWRPKKGKKPQEGSAEES